MLNLNNPTHKMYVRIFFLIMGAYLLYTATVNTDEYFGEPHGKLNHLNHVLYWFFGFAIILISLRLPDIIERHKVFSYFDTLPTQEKYQVYKTINSLDPETKKLFFAAIAKKKPVMIHEAINALSKIEDAEVKEHIIKGLNEIKNDKVIIS